MDGPYFAATDVELATALCAREPAAFTEAFRRHASSVARTARATGGGHIVEDVVQEVYLTLLRAPGRFDPERGSLGAYLQILARGRTVDAVRSDGARQRRHRDQDHRANANDHVERDALGSVSAAELRTALSVLPMTERVALELAFFGGNTYRQVAAKLDQPEGTIKSRIRTGLRRLEAALIGLGATEGG